VQRETSPTPSHDAFWIFALWRALHGGDAMLADIAAAVIANLSQYLPAQEDSFGVAPLPASRNILAFPGAEDSESTEDRNSDVLMDQSDPEESSPLFCCDPCELSIYHNYFNFKGVFYRIDRPAIACLPTAA
jgi:hypothetical protein